MIECPKTLLFASTNPGKFTEMQRVFDSYNITILFALNEKSLTLLPKKPPPHVEETGKSYLENASIKAQAFYEWANLPTIADDAGLEVQALHGAPGLFSARYAGTGASSQDNIDKLLRALKGQENRQACFISSLVLKIDNKTTFRSEGRLWGEITREPKGRGGFGYDSIFMLQGAGETLAELKERSAEVDSHRVIAVKQLFLGSDAALNPNCLSAS